MIVLGKCPHCGGGCDLAREKNDFRDGFPYEWRVSCRCGYSGPFDADKEAAARKHNKMSQMCGAS